MKTRVTYINAGMSVVFIFAALIMPVSRAAPATQPATQEQIVHDLTLDAVRLADAIPEDLDVSDRSAREKAGMAVLPIVHHALALIDQLPPNCKGESMSSMRINWEPMLIVFGDAEFTAKEKEISNDSGDAALHAKICMSLADLTLAGGNVVKAEKAAKIILDRANSVPQSDDMAFALMHLREDDRLSAETESLAARLLARSQAMSAETFVSPSKPPRRDFPDDIFSSDALVACLTPMFAGTSLASRVR